MPDRLQTPLRQRSSTCVVWIDNEFTAVADYRAADRVRLSLEPWANVAPELDGISRGELDDSALLRAVPWWGEPTGERP